MYRFINVIIELSLPITYVENAAFRDIGDIAVNISVKSFREKLFKMVELVENRVANYMKQTKGAVKYDGWTKNGTQYVAVYAIMMKKVRHLVEGQDILREELAMHLQSMTPIAKRDDESEVISVQAISFDAAT